MQVIRLTRIQEISNRERTVVAAVRIKRKSHRRLDFPGLAATGQWKSRRTNRRRTGGSPVTELRSADREQSRDGFAGSTRERHVHQQRLRSFIPAWQHRRPRFPVDCHRALVQPFPEQRGRTEICVLLAQAVELLAEIIRSSSGKTIRCIGVCGHDSPIRSDIATVSNHSDRSRCVYPI